MAIAACAARMESEPTAEDLTAVLRANPGLIGDIATDNADGIYYQEHCGQQQAARALHQSADEDPE